MRRALVLVIAALLVNIPWVHDAWTNHRIDAGGRPTQGIVLDARTIHGRHLVDYRLPTAADPARTRYTARLDDAAYERARASGRIALEAVPGNPGLNRPDGAVTGSLFVVVAAIADLVLLLVAVALWWRWRRWRRKVVVDTDGDQVTVAVAGRHLVATYAGPDPARGAVLYRDLVLLADADVRGTGRAAAAEGLERIDGGRYRIRGRVVDVDREHTDLRLADGFVLRVDVGRHRCRADLRELAEVTGRLHLPLPGS